MKLLRAANAVFLRFRFACSQSTFTLPVLEKRHFRRLNNSIIVLGCLFFLTACQDDKSSNTKLDIINAAGETHSFKVEVVTTPEDQAKGLMFRESMPEDEGMLFYFGDEAERGFWMKNTLIPLDMIFIKSDGTIHRIHENAIPHDLTSVASFGKVSAVLEVNGGISRKLGFKAGDQVKHAVFK